MANQQTVDWHGDTFMKAVGNVTRSRLREAGRAVVRYVKSKMKGRSQRTAKGVKVRTSSSAPGQPPHKFTGNLFKSLGVRLRKKRIAAKVGAFSPHSHLLEFGTANRGKTGAMAARPFLRPALSAMQSTIKQIMLRPIKPRMPGVRSR
jgi:phage gpG-like protein